MKLINKKIFFPIPPLLALGVLIVLLPVFALMTIDRMEKQKFHIQERLMVRGISLIRTFEAGTRTGMLTMRWGARRVQAMLMETVAQPDVEYMMITTKEGNILAHSDPALVGTKFSPMPKIVSDKGDMDQVFHRARKVGGEPMFEVYKRFTPLSIGFRGHHRGGSSMGMKRGGSSPMHGSMGMGHPERKNGIAGGEYLSDMTEHYIFAGLSMARAVLAQEQVVRKTLGRGIFFFIIGCAGVISLLAFQAYRSAKASLTSVKAFSDNVVQNMPAGLVTIDQDHRVTSINRAAMEILGHKPEKAFPGMSRLVYEMEVSGGAVSREVSLDMGKAPELRLDMTASSILDNEGEVLGFLFLFRDLTQIKKLKKEVETNRHLAAIGKLAAGVAHEIRNPLSSIKGFATYFGKRYRENQGDSETAMIMVQEVERINRSITQLLEFAKPMAVEIKEVEISPLIHHSLKLVNPDLEKKSIVAAVDVTTEKKVFRTDPDRINQILLNLYMNALNAMEKGGRLTITVDDSRDRKYIKISVEDTGCGIASKNLDLIFDPYFTTRPEGTGLGLSIVHRTVESLKGEIRVESLQGRGSCFIIKLPCGHQSGLETKNPAGKDYEPNNESRDTAPGRAGTLRKEP